MAIHTTSGHAPPRAGEGETVISPVEPGENLTGLVQAGNGYVVRESATNLTVRLSKLQRWMLVRAHQNRLAGERVDLFYGEVLAHFYGFCRPEEVRTRTAFMGQFFQPELIGRGRYNAACAAVSRAARRLDDRGLARVMRAAYGHWASIRLTDAGVTLAASLTDPGPRAGSAA